MEAQYEVYELIGEGSFGKVFRGRCRQTHMPIAYKIISKIGRNLSEVIALREECEIQKHLRHPNIIRMLNSFENDNELVVITEFAQKDLCHILKEEGLLDENGAQKIIRDLISALYYLHSNHVLHRDLKPQNVLLDYNGNAKLCDFGFAKVLVKDSQMLTSIKGTPLYMAPELMQELPYDQNADLWSLGCIAYELVTGHPPYTTSSILQLVKMVRAEPIKWPNYLSDSCLSLLRGLLQKNPASRLSWPYLLYHPFIYSDVIPNFPQLAAGSQGRQNISLNQTETISFVPQMIQSVSAFSNRIRYDQFTGENYGKFIPSTFNEVKNQPTFMSNTSATTQTCQKKTENETTDSPFLAEKEEWLEFLKKTISNVMYDGDVDVLIEEHSFMLIINTFNKYNACPIIVTSVARLLSLPFVVELISETQLVQIRQIYAHCGLIQHLLVVVKRIVTEFCPEKLGSSHELALQQLLILVCNLVFMNQILLYQFFNVCISLNLFKIIRNCFYIRTKEDPFSVIKYVLALFLRLYILVPQSRYYICEAIESCSSEFHMILRNYEDKTVHSRLCTFITVLSCTQPEFLRESPVIDTLIKDLTFLKNNSIIPSIQQIMSGTLEALKKIGRQQ